MREKAMRTEVAFFVCSSFKRIICYVYVYTHKISTYKYILIYKPKSVQGLATYEKLEIVM